MSKNYTLFPKVFKVPHMATSVALPLTSSKGAGTYYFRYVVDGISRNIGIVASSGDEELVLDASKLPTNREIYFEILDPTVGDNQGSVISYTINSNLDATPCLPGSTSAACYDRFIIKREISFLGSSVVGSEKVYNLKNPEGVSI